MQQFIANLSVIEWIALVFSGLVLIPVLLGVIAMILFYAIWIWEECREVLYLLCAGIITFIVVTNV